MGTGSGESRRAQREAQRAEEGKKARITAATGRVNRVFDAPERQAQYQDFVSAVRDNFMRDANRQHKVNDRSLRFSMARNGLSGGSADRDARRTLGEEFTQGVIKSEDQAQAALGNLKQQDEQARMGILQMVQTGMDTTTATARAGAAMQASAQGAASRATAEGLGDIFGATADVYKKQQEQQAFRAGQRAPVGSVYGDTPWK